MNSSNLFRTKSIASIQQDAEQGLSDATHSAGGLTRALGVVDLTALGIAAIIGAGIFSMIGTASANGGPAVVILFIFTAAACAFSAMCYAQFASAVPIAGSAYTYAYTFGELIAWIIGWDLIVEYAIGNIAVAISWSDYFTRLLSGYGINIPEYLTMDFLTASRGFAEITEKLAAGNTLEQVRSMADVKPGVLEAYTAWQSAPRVGGIPIICDLPALMIVLLITVIVYVGIRESKRASNIMVVLKLATIIFVIVLGAFYVRAENWTPFAPNGVGGVLGGIAAVFFSYIGFDALSTTAEECKNPQRDLPRAMLLSLAICTVLFVLIGLVLTGMVNYSELAVGDPLAYVFSRVGLDWVAGIVSFSAVIALATVLLVFQLGQPRIWMAMSRDGLLPPIFSAIHPRFRTPWFATILTGILVAVPALFMNLTEVTDLAVIGTLFAFVLVCGGVLLLDREGSKAQGKFVVPYINSRFIIAPLLLLIAAALYHFNPEGVQNFFSFSDPKDATLGAWEVFKHKIPLLVFLVLTAVLGVLTVLRNLSLIPVLGLLSCGYLMTELGITNWIRFGLWLLLGLVIYFLYGYRHSKLGRRIEAAEDEAR